MIRTLQLWGVCISLAGVVAIQGATLVWQRPLPSTNEVKAFYVYRAAFPATNATSSSALDTWRTLRIEQSHRANPLTLEGHTTPDGRPAAESGDVIAQALIDRLDSGPGTFGATKVPLPTADLRTFNEPLISPSLDFKVPNAGDLFPGADTNSLFKIGPAGELQLVTPAAGQTNPAPGELVLITSNTWATIPDVPGRQKFFVRAFDGVRESESAVLVYDPASRPPTAPGGLTNVENAIINGSFEKGTASWSLAGNVELQSAPQFPATDGTRLLVFNAGQRVPSGIANQTFSAVPGVKYQLRFDAGIIAYLKSSQLFQVNISGGRTLATRLFTLEPPAENKTVFQTFSIAFEPDREKIRVQFVDLSTATDSVDWSLDNVVAIPMP